LCDAAQNRWTALTVPVPAGLSDSGRHDFLGGLRGALPETRSCSPAAGEISLAWRQPDALSRPGHPAAHSGRVADDGDQRSLARPGLEPLSKDQAERAAGRPIRDQSQAGAPEWRSDLLA